MNESLKVTRKFHVARRHHGRKQIRDGRVPDVPVGRDTRIARLMALAIRCDQLIRGGIIANQSLAQTTADVGGTASGSLFSPRRGDHMIAQGRA